MGYERDTVLSQILNRNEQSNPFLGSSMYTKLQTRYIHYCHGWINSLSQNLLHSYSSNTVNISTMVMVGFWLFQFNTGSLAWSSVCHRRLAFFVWLL